MVLPRRYSPTLLSSSHGGNVIRVRSTTKNVPGRTATLVEFEHGSEPPMLRRLRERLLALSCGTCLDCKAIVGHNWHNCERCRRHLWASR
jgi:hypothetical protein